MLRRVRSQNRKGKLHIPRRGRIRAVLILSAVIAAGFAYVGRNDAEPDTTETKGAGKNNTASTNAHITATPRLRKTARLIQKGETLQHDDISALLRQSPPDFTTPAHTVSLDGRELTLHLSIDTSLQKSAQKNLVRYHPKYGAVAALDPVSGRVLALVSYTNPDDTPLAHDLYARSIFPAASIVKIITAAAAVERGGLTPGSALKTYGANHTLYSSQLTKELRVSREVSLREAFAYSINPVFGRLGIYTLGAPALREYLTKFGFNESIPFELHTEQPRADVADSAFAIAEISSGFNQRTVISPLFGALIAAAISHDGSMPVPSLVDSARDLQSDSCLYRSTPRPWRMPIRPETAAEIRELMTSVARFGTARKSFMYIKRSGRFANIEYGGKTGNVDMDGVGRADWFVGYARHTSDPAQNVAVGVVTVHGPNWTVHSSYLGAEIIRAYIRAVQIAQEKAPTDSATVSKAASKDDKDGTKG